MTPRAILAHALGGCLFFGWCWIMLGLIYVFGPMVAAHP